MAELFDRLQQLAAARVLPADQQQLVRSVLRQRAAGWPDAEAPEQAAGMVLLQVGAAGAGGEGEEEEDWRAVLDSKAPASAEVQDSANASPAREGPAKMEGGVPGGAADQAQQADVAQQKQQAVQQLVAAAPAAAAWDVPALVQQVREQGVLDLAAAEDAEQLLAALLDHAAASAVAAGAGAEGSQLLGELSAAVDGCAALVAELAARWPAAGVAAVAHLVAAFKHRSEARSPAARHLLGQQMLVAGDAGAAGGAAGAPAARHAGAAVAPGGRGGGGGKQGGAWHGTGGGTGDGRWPLSFVCMDAWLPGFAPFLLPSRVELVCGLQPPCCLSHPLCGPRSPPRR